MKFENRGTNHGRRFKLKGLLLLVLIAGGSFLLASELPVIDNFLNGFDCGLVTHSGSIRGIAVINEVGESWDLSFNSTMSRIVRAAGYGYDYYGFGTAGVDFFVHLPLKGYSVVLVLAHGANLAGAIATSDPYSSDQWVGDQLSGRVTRVSVDGTNQQYFGLTPKFIDEMCGNFRGALVLFMGCSAMGSTDIAAAFVRKGTKAFVGWDNGVTVALMDTASQMLLRQLLGGERLGEAVNSVMGALGQAPVYESQLLYYPGNASSYQVALPD